MFILLFSVLVAVCMIAVSAEDDPSLVPAVSEYGLYVGSTAVTEENKDDILGDGTAEYDPEKKQLIIDDATVTGGASSGDFIYSVLSADACDIVVRGECSFAYGIYTSSGDIRIDRAKVTFEGKAGGYSYVTSAAGDVNFEHSKVTCQSLAGIEDYAFSGKNVIVNDTDLQVAVGGTEKKVDALFWAEEALSVDDSDIRVACAYPTIAALFTCEGTLGFYSSKFACSGYDYFAYMTDGVFYIDRSELVGTGSYGFYIQTPAEFTRSKITLSAYYQAMILSGEYDTEEKIYTQKNQIILRNVDLSLTGLGFDHMEKNVLPMLWRDFGENMMGSYPDLRSYIAACRIAYEETMSGLGDNALNITAVDFSMRGGYLKSAGYGIGVGASCASTLAFFDNVDISLSCRNAAFLVFGADADALWFGEEGIKGDYIVEQVDVSSYLPALGRVLLTLVPTGSALSCDLTGKTAEHTSDVLTDVTGYATTVSLRADAHIPAWVWAAIAAAVLVVAVVCVYVIFVYRSRSEKGKSAK